MAIYFKHDIEKRLQALEEHYVALKHALKGRMLRGNTRRPSVSKKIRFVKAAYS
ncbi:MULTISPECIES: hypothetical protein [Pseudomonas]|uniref:hypothetical protein n=1 Tax=Pseudomonas TaxID=286 RepID=UPI001BE55830|nr:MULTISPECIES: hypothetical protein [Pseudomonas]MBT2339443.1 hypothetical protein [Pseudomonas fluorescens]MCD4529323.1 hypothetical protein [Pseudomonas sp. C3-2018]